MGYAPIELIALIFIVISLIKIIILLVNRDFWMGHIIKKILNHPHATGFIFLILSLVVLWYLLLGLTIIQVIAVMAFTTLFMGFGMLLYVKPLEKIIKSIRKDKYLIKHGLVYIILWIIILLWGLKEIIL